MATDLAGRPKGRQSQSVRFMEYEHFIERQLGRARSQIKSVEVLTSVAILVTGALVYLMAGALLDHWLIPGGLSSRGRWIAFGGFALAALSYLSVALLVPMIPELLRLPWLARLSRLTGLPVLRRIHLYYAARTIERSQGTLKNSLVNFLDLRRAELPPSVLHAVERQAAADLSRIEVEHAVDRDRLIQVLYLLLGVVAITCLYTLFSPKSTLTAFGRMLFPGASIAPATQTRIDEVEPGDATVFAGERVRITARVSGRVVPDELTLYYTTATRQVVEQAVPMRPESRGSRRFAVELPHDTLEGVQESFQYFLRGGDATTPVYAIRVIVPPTATVESVRYVYPEYTGLESKTVPLADIAALEGTEVTVRARTNMGVSRAKLDFGGDAANDLLMEASNRELSVSFRLALDSSGEALYDSYRIDFQTTDGQRNPRPSVHAIKVRPDLAPEVSLVSPGRDVELPSNGVLALVVEASDPDFALGGVKLFIREGDTEEPEMIPLGESPLGSRLRATYTLDLESRGAKVGDVLQYWVEARDNKQPESNHAQTAVYSLRVVEPVSDEQRREMAERAENVAQGKTPDEDRAGNEPTDQIDRPEPENPEEKSQERPDKPEEAAQEPETPQEQKQDTAGDEQDDVEKLKRIMEQMRKTGQLPPQQQEPQKSSDDAEQEAQQGEQQKQNQSEQQGADSAAGEGSKGQQQPGAKGNQSNQSKGSSGESSARDDAGDVEQGPQGASQPGDADSQPQKSGAEQSSEAADRAPSKQPTRPGEVPQTPQGDQLSGPAGQQGNPTGTGSREPGGATRDEQAPSEGSQPSAGKPGAEGSENNGEQTEGSRPSAGKQGAEVGENNGEQPNEKPNAERGAGAQQSDTAAQKGSEQAEGNRPDEPSASQGSRPSGEKPDAEAREDKGDQPIEKSSAKPGPGQRGPNPNSDAAQPQEDNPAGTAQPGRAEPRPAQQTGGREPSTDKGSAPAPAQQHATPGQAAEKQPSPTSDNAVKPSSREDKQPSESPSADRSEGNSPGNAASQQQQKASKTQGTGSMRQFSGKGEKGEGQRGQGQGENQPGTKSAGQSGGAPSDQSGKEAISTQPGDDTPSTKPGEQPGPGPKKPGNTQSGPGPSSSQGGTEPGDTPKQQSGAGTPGNQPSSTTSSDRQEPPSDESAAEDRPQPSEPDRSEGEPADQRPPENQSSSNQSSGVSQDRNATDQPPQGGGGQSSKPQPGGRPNANSPPAGGAGNQPNPGAGQATAPEANRDVPPPSAPNLEYTRKAANLTLDRLDDQLRRKRVDDELLDQFGGDEKRLKDFVERMRDKLDERATDPAKLRDVLDRLRRPVGASNRKAADYQREVGDVVDRGRTQPPLELRDRVNAYIKRISERSMQRPKKNP